MKYCLLIFINSFITLFVSLLFPSFAVVPITIGLIISNILGFNEGFSKAEDFMDEQIRKIK